MEQRERLNIRKSIAPTLEVRPGPYLAGGGDNFPLEIQQSDYNALISVISVSQGIRETI